MKVKIKTENGWMEVDLDAFIPASRARMRKLFRLMRTGLEDEEKEEVLQYLRSRRNRDLLAEKRQAERRAQEEVSQLERAVLKAKDALAEGKLKLRAARMATAAEARIQEQLPAWIRDFWELTGYEEEQP